MKRNISSKLFILPISESPIGRLLTARCNIRDVKTGKRFQKQSSKITANDARGRGSKGARRVRGEPIARTRQQVGGGGGNEMERGSHDGEGLDAGIPVIPR